MGFGESGRANSNKKKMFKLFPKSAHGKSANPMRIELGHANGTWKGPGWDMDGTWRGIGHREEQGQTLGVKEEAA